MRSNVSKIISSVERQLTANAWLKSFLITIAISLLLYITSSPIITISGAFITLALSLYFTGAFSSQKQNAINYLHSSLQNSEYSLDLLDKPDLNIAEQLQLSRLNESLSDQKTPNVLGKGLALYFSLLGIALLLFIVLPEISLQKKNNINEEIQNTVKPSNRKKIQIPEFKNAVLNIQPPAYTQISPSKSENLNASAIAGSILKWQITFSDPENIRLVINNNRNEEINFIRNANSFEYTDRLVSSGLYGLKAYFKDSLIYQSDFYHLEAIPDLAPKIEPKTKDLYSFHFLNDAKNLQLSAKITDDFLVKQVYLVATLARGSGENVKFREVKFPISENNFKTAQVNKKIDLRSLNFSPGDELYYYWAAIDNKTPEPNFTKSDTYFVIYKDTASLSESEITTMAVNVFPEYFRSQRQIIIDTEKLIAKRKKSTEKQFASASNEIGFDQKSLRIRYGQYLGEEYESSAGGVSHDLEHDAENPLEGFMHKHDHEGEHEHGHEHHHDHGNSTAPAEGSNSLADILAEYVHNHDDAESNTFYEQSTRSLLKAALEQMWQSELHLRMAEPEKALPYEHKALELLKEAQHKARTFIAKTSYDPPPLKEKERRMKGELTKFNAQFSSERQLTQTQIRNLAAEVISWLDNKEKLNTVQTQKVMLLSSQMSSTVINSGLTNWNVLSSLRKLVNNQPLNAEEKNKLKRGLYELTAVQKNAVTPSYSTEKRLEKAFLKNMSK